MAPIDLSAAPACADFARDERIDPAGTAGSYPHIAVIEVPLPWTADIGDHPLVAPAAPALAAAGVRVQAVIPRDEGTAAHRRLAHFRRPGGPFRAYEMHEQTVAEGDLVDALVALARSADAPWATAPVPDTEVLVCSHARRDACCGARGRQIVTAMPAQELWRTSHTGGHRFAPTALILPEGTAWAYLDETSLPAIVARTLDVDAAAALYRGCTGLADPAVQAVEREAFRSLGWSWFDHHRTGRVLAVDGARTWVQIDHRAPDGATGSFRAAVEVSRRLPIPDCGRPLHEARKDANELRVTDFGPQ